METAKLVLDLLLGFAKGLAWGIIFLIVAIVILPENILFKILKKFKPNIILKSKILLKVRMFCDYIFCNKEIALKTINSDSEKFQESLPELLKEKKLVESNLFFSIY